jgi:hypothetical protein
MPLGQRGDIGARGALAMTLSIWALVALPFVAVGPPDFEEYFTGVTSTKLAVDGVLRGAWPFWSTDLGLGTPLPLRYHFITHPFALACHVADCHRVLRATAAVHMLLGAACLGLIAHRFVRHRLLAATAASTFLLSSSAVQTLLTDDWPISAIGEGLFPVMLLCSVALCESASRGGRLLWSLALGLSAGLFLSMSIPFSQLIILALVALCMPNGPRRLGWFVLAAFVTLLIGGAHIQHVLEEVLRNPPGVARRDHIDFGLMQHAWSILARPVPVAELEIQHWRSAFWGPPLAWAAVVALFAPRRRAEWWIHVGFWLGLAGLCIPPEWLFDVQTAAWTYRSYLNVFGLLLGVLALGRLAAADSARWLPAVVLTQMLWLSAAVFRPWVAVAAPSVGLAPAGEARLASRGIAQEIATIVNDAPGRVVFAPKAEYAAKFNLRFNERGLAINQLAHLGLPVLTAYTWGITTDEISPQPAMVEGAISAPEGALGSRAWLDVLGVRYVLALPDDDVAQGLRLLRSFDSDLRLLENETAWPLAFFVEQSPPPRIPRLSSCDHDRFLCADFAQAELRRADTPLQPISLGDGFRLEFAPSAAARDIVLTQWYRPGWTVTAGNAAVARVAEHFVGVRVAAGERAVTVRFRPRLQASLFVVALAAEALAAFGIAALWWTGRRRPASPPLERASRAPVPERADVG